MRRTSIDYPDRKREASDRANPLWCSPRTHPQMNTFDQCWLLSVCLLQSLNPTEVLGGVVLQDEKVRGTATSPHIRCTATASSAYPGTITGPRNCGGTSL